MYSRFALLTALYTLCEILIHSLFGGEHGDYYWLYHLLHTTMELVAALSIGCRCSRSPRSSPSRCCPPSPPSRSSRRRSEGRTSSPGGRTCSWADPPTTRAGGGGGREAPPRPPSSSSTRETRSRETRSRETGSSRRCRATRPLSRPQRAFRRTSRSRRSRSRRPRGGSGACAHDSAICCRHSGRRHRRRRRLTHALRLPATRGEAAPLESMSSSLQPGEATLMWSASLRPRRKWYDSTT
ncbi:hypothetical protein EMIHUDRAFT_436626 [Emiliania huxleyi CCMP1516]|uniref:TLC domain-containing protein n=2 Tax=Emiliania huxleyi TaxID=2903 RepID=A0A0D3IXK2_EMIH1|nr:hypothetical protein EMIHUDRAFT_436626 [Emiliania huxleyi CCMP1516]EOD15987.1 hypothetical protein EMIHUDRAFT_436626 [Emiliania huxleyi CCMP1516]|eukprot:XP_005768416.1 hypothetical protein EMIHUDRAFT_436626 [Emiliania huxleyi CCMP1516]